MEEILNAHLFARFLMLLVVSLNHKQQLTTQLVMDWLGDLIEQISFANASYLLIGSKISLLCCMHIKLLSIHIKFKDV